MEITSCGLNPSCLAGRGLYEARIACRLWGKNGATLYGLGDRPIDKTNPYFTQDGEDREDNPDQHISSMNDGSVAGFKYFDLENLSQITVKIRGSAEGTLTVSDELSGNIIAEIPVHPSDDWGNIVRQHMQTMEKRHSILPTMGLAHSISWTLNWFKISEPM